MPYNAFTLARVQTDFGVTVETGVDLFGAIPRVSPDPVVITILDRFRGLAAAIGTEKAKSELIIVPLLSEVWRVGANRVALFSGVTFNVDPEADLAGVCDFILGLPPQLDFVTAPVMMITEAKNDSVVGGFGQCAATMVAAQRFNARRKSDITTIYGCVSNGVEWKFLRLRGTTLEIDMHYYTTSEPDRILGIILHFVGLSPLSSPAAA